MPRVHLHALTTTGDVDIALSPDSAAALLDALTAAVAAAADAFTPTRVDVPA